MPVKKAHPEADSPHGDIAAAETFVGTGPTDHPDLAERESRWNYALVGSGLGVWDHNYRLNRKYYSPTWKTIRGMAPDEDVAGDYEAWLQLVHPDDRDFVVHAIERQNAGDPEYQVFQYRERHRDGRWIWIDCRGACVEWDENGVPTRVVGTDTDITARKEAEETLSRLSRRLDLALEISRIGVFEADIENDVVEWDDRLIAIYGMQGAARKIGGDAWAKRLHPDDRERVLDLADRSVESGSDFQQEYRIIRGDGVERIIRARSAFFVDGNGQRKLIGANWDVTEEVALRDELQRAKDLAEARNRELEAAKESIEYLALHDYLTGLPNRRYLDKMLDDRAAECRANGLALAILHIDLDRFKQINDTLGHRAGDAMLQHAAHVLRHSVRAADFVARIGGDEFVILCAVDPASMKIANLAERLIRELRRPVRYEGHDCRFGASIGIAVNGGAKLDAKQTLLDADIALYRAKGLGRNRFEFFSASARDDIVSAKRLADQILIGLDRHEFVPFYQLQFDAGTLDVAGVETLARWQHPVHGLLTPDRFLDIAEDLDVVSTIDALILERALADRRTWIKEGLSIPKISVNVSARRLTDPDLGKKLRALKIEPGAVAFELLESISLDDCDKAVAANLKKLRKLGIDIHIDDFGTGHASIVSLLRLSPNTLKIDRELIRMLPQSAEQRKLVGSIIDIGRSLNILVIAEGVETADHIRILEQLGCDTLQGYALARPMPATQIPSFIRAGSWRHGLTAARALQTHLRRALPSRTAK
ncbi:EAL domain-containing protein [Rhizobium bangladeshense]|uniref:EAL domain-containing protein n=1 Tax=Rhizobium bangladeshense TaxID=1138189 RepID=A0ABS7LQQ8_9HYPH|nr:EAL domain-containing protein [Rhizobium bangladeshense]MBX4867847.1 EAL domain-containing protein [Rhizobium bangladeshense]MBX4875136.1 EAL domain-containing protein [Rhizobium bangladeshense]MBX4886049.1 EAL domain-containing protein [Rhizobium bangladeshense]MBY3593812.1 EAL domain-containing protein [Rhizobium bangladeshense]